MPLPISQGQKARPRCHDGAGMKMFCEDNALVCHWLYWARRMLYAESLANGVSACGRTASLETEPPVLDVHYPLQRTLSNEIQGTKSRNLSLLLEHSSYLQDTRSLWTLLRQPTKM